MMSIRAHFDGRVIVPDEPVTIARNANLLVWVESEPASKAAIDQAIQNYYLGMSSVEQRADDAWESLRPADQKQAWDED